MPFSSSYKLIFLGLFITLLAIVSHQFLPDKRLLIYPKEGIDGVIYADEADGGKSRATWVDEERLHWRCDVREGVLHRYCGFHIDFAAGTGKGLDLSGYTAVRVKLVTMTSESRLRLYFRNFEEGFSIVEDVETAKFNNVLLPISELDDELTVKLNEFSVAEWWINERNVPRKFAAPNFDNVLTVGIDLGVPPGIGVHEIRLELIEFIGEWVSAEHWYRGILFIWIGVVAVIGLVRYVQIKRRLMLERVMLEELANHNSKLQDESEKYRELSSLDNLTGALNRHGFDDVMAALQGSSSAGDDAALLILDLDHFKGINDKLGHDVGDKVLKGVADALVENIRQSDRLARWGGEEFIVLCPTITEQGAVVLAEKLRTVVAELKFLTHPDLRVTVSIGVGIFKLEEHFDNVFKRTDIALYKAKKRGRNRVVKAAK